jgi:hypothetical protein
MEMGQRTLVSQLLDKLETLVKGMELRKAHIGKHTKTIKDLVVELEALPRDNLKTQALASQLRNQALKPAAKTLPAPVLQ